MFHTKEQQRSYSKILCPKTRTGSSQDLVSNPLLCRINQQYFHLTQHQSSTAMTSRELQGCQKWFASLG